MSFATDLKAFADKVERRGRDVFVASTVEVRRSLVEGSELTGAPGQPVDTGALKASFVDEFIGAEGWQISTNLDYAPGIEDAIGPSGRITIRSPVGGSHSSKQTRAGWPRIIEHVNRTVA